MAGASGCTGGGSQGLRRGEQISRRRTIEMTNPFLGHMPATAGENVAEKGNFSRLRGQRRPKGNFPEHGSSAFSTSDVGLLSNHMADGLGLRPPNLTRGQTLGSVADDAGGRDVRDFSEHGAPAVSAARIRLLSSHMADGLGLRPPDLTRGHTLGSASTADAGGGSMAARGPGAGWRAGEGDEGPRKGEQLRSRRTRDTRNPFLGHEAASTRENAAAKDTSLSLHGRRRPKGDVPEHGSSAFSTGYHGRPVQQQTHVGSPKQSELPPLPKSTRKPAKDAIIPVETIAEAKPPVNDKEISRVGFSEIKDLARELRSATGASDAHRGTLRTLVDLCRSNLKQLTDTAQKEGGQYDLGELVNVHELAMDAIQAAEKKMEALKSNETNSKAECDVFSLLCHLRSKKQKRHDAAWGLLR